ncbi:NAD(P)-dependent alcohol dehydrogenase [Nocardioides marmoriginsengisoli]|uniref:NAD(P)-dependent alcohol dehydrogenase n=1 Tax=Nocardioides marmoriginsengisoli TaxID=661483 RepID=A0A3N0CHU6_9ACTN|nr:NAD(P)-dependent alcohol dehydrogenase [Nocardioides marmoriginsengisoli]RNL62861.1 NAD(P)-dependent alcohol dehydrogenase [Nocardioides marmoriginsengisoli]
MKTLTTAAVLRSPEAGFALEQIQLADLGPTEVLVRIAGVGFCHTDMMARSAMSWLLPGILGHEGSGIVQEVGAGVDSVKPGDAVVLSFASCGACGQCERGRPSYCAQFFELNLTGRAPDGGTSASDRQGHELLNRWFGQSSFAEHSIVDQRNVVAVAADLPLHLLAPLGCGIQTGAGTVLRALKLQPGQSIVVFGAGAVGLAAVMAAKMAGAKDIVAVDLHKSRLTIAKELGATRTIVGTDADLVAKITDGGIGLDFAFDTTGVTSVMEQAIAAVGPGGEIALVAASEAALSFHPTLLTGKRLSYVMVGDADPQEFIPYLIGQWVAGEFPFDRLITTYAFEDISKAEADSHSGSVIKPVLVLGQG